MHYFLKETPETKKRRQAREGQRKHRARIAKPEAADVPLKEDPLNMASTSILITQSSVRDPTSSDVERAKKAKFREKMRAYRARRKQSQDATQGQLQLKRLEFFPIHLLL